MKKIAPLLLCTLAWLAAPGMAETWENTPVVDKMCSAKAKADPNAHTRSCALQCKESGFGLVTEKGEFLALDDAGSKKLVAALQSSDRKDNVRVDVTGNRNGDTIAVKELAIR